MRNTGIVLALVACTLAAGAVSAGELTLYRDTWGVPHIYADTPAQGAYGLGYAMAADRLADIYKNIHTALGTAAEHFGPDYVRTDYAMRMTDNAGLCEAYWPEAPAHVRALGEAYVRGVEAYVSEHPEAKPDFAFPLAGWHTAAVGRTMMLQWPLGTLFDDYKNRPEGPPFASNGWAIGPERSAADCAVLLTDPHLSWEGLALFYEARVFGGDLVMNGFFLAGTPLMALGHTANVGWACTTGGPDTGDVYMLPVREAPIGFQYRYEDEWKIPKLKVFHIKVKGEEEPRTMPAAFTVHGPLLGEPDFENGVAYAGKTPYMNDTGSFEQLHAMAMADDAHAFFEVLRMNHFMEQNLIFADRDGNIGYARVGRTPIRPEGPWSWSKPVPGDTAATAWKGIHDVRDLVWTINPDAGYLQSCNTSPAMICRDSPLTPDKYKPYIYNVSWDKTNPRGRRALDLLAANDQVTVADAKAITMDVYDLLAKPWQAALQEAVQTTGDDLDAAVKEAAERILAWDGKFTSDSKAAPLYRAWRLAAPKAEVDVAAIAAGAALPEEQQRKLIAVLADTLTAQKALYGENWPVTWGDMHVVGRSGRFFPCDGADFGRGQNTTETLRDVEASEQPEGSGRLVADSGSMAAMLMFFHKTGIESYSATQWGASADPDSPHHVDQARDLYGPRKMKPTWFKKAALLDHVESKEVLNAP
ncbi:MAG: penicillin acylase family protein [Candidatus Hydrogenedentota bacterium]